MAKIITFAAWKGGVGKTTLVYNLSLLASEKKILIIDIDPQTNLSKRFLRNWDHDIINNPLPLKTAYDHLDIIASNNNLMNSWDKVNLEFLIAKYQNDYDYIILDTPPSFNKEIIKAFDLSSEIYLITDDSIMSVEGLFNTLNNYLEYKTNKNEKSNIKGIILNNLNKFKATKDLITSLKDNELTTKLLIEPFIYKRSSIAKTMLYSQPITKMKDSVTKNMLIELSKKIFG